MHAPSKLATSVALCCVRKNDEDVEDLDEDVYCSIAVTKYIGVGMNPEHSKVLSSTPAPLLQLVTICSGCDQPKWPTNNIIVDFLLLYNN